jgi:hypothetical protein
MKKYQRGCYVLASHSDFQEPFEDTPQEKEESFLLEKQV